MKTKMTDKDILGTIVYHRTCGIETYRENINGNFRDVEYFTNSSDDCDPLTGANAYQDRRVELETEITSAQLLRKSLIDQRESEITGLQDEIETLSTERETIYDSAEYIKGTLSDENQDRLDDLDDLIALKEKELDHVETAQVTFDTTWENHNGQTLGNFGSDFHTRSLANELEQLTDAEKEYISEFRYCLGDGYTQEESAQVANEGAYN